MKEPERAILENNRRLNADGEKIANDAMIGGLDQQQLDLTVAAGRLEELQKNAQDAFRQMAAIQVANQRLRIRAASSCKFAPY